MLTGSANHEKQQMPKSSFQKKKYSVYQVLEISPIGLNDIALGLKFNESKYGINQGLPAVGI